MMKLKKNNWDKQKVENVCQVISGGTPSRIIPEYFGGDILWLTPTEIPKEKISFINDSQEKITELGLKKSSAKVLPVGTVMLTSRATIGLIGIAGKSLTTNQGFANFICDSKKISNRFLAYWLYSKIDLIKSLSAGTTFKEISKTTLRNLEIFVPSLPEQTQIAELFQSIETAIEQAEQQENNLLKLKKTLSNGLLNKEAAFGNLLNKKNCTLTNFGGIADCDVQHDKEKKDISRFIGLENIETENLKITTWGNISDGTTFTKRFSKGDVLFGKRRAYLKKVAVADFDGICSADILVLKAKEKKMLKELLPFYVSAEAFINHAVSTSAGSLSPRTKWKDLSLLEISIPDLKTQEKILEVFQQIETTLSQLKTQKQTLKNLKQKLLNEILG